jgi:membrane glycosyltransferase
LETVVFTLLAPVLMLFHTEFVIRTLLRQKNAWGTQRRGRAGESALAETVQAHWAHTAIGLAGAEVADRIDWNLAVWMSPIFAGLVGSIPISLLTGSVAAGEAVRREGLLKVPEESRPLPELARLNARMAAIPPERPMDPALRAHYGLMQAVLDPYVNAVHVSLLHAKDEIPAASEERFLALRERLVREGPAALTDRDRMALLMDADSMVALHDQVWSTPAARLGRWWQLALEQYDPVARLPETPFSRGEEPFANAAGAGDRLASPGANPDA